MSSHTIDLSGQRLVQLTLNDPAKTALWAPAKAGDDVTAEIAGFREVRVALPDGARLQRRRYIRKSIRHARGNGEGRGPALKDPDRPGEYLYDEVPYEQTVLVIPGGGTFYGRASILDGEENPPTHESTPHTTVRAVRSSDLHFLESGELLSEQTIGEVVAPTEGG